MKIESLEFPVKNPKPCYIWKIDVEDHENINVKILKTIENHRKINPEGYSDYINVDVWQTDWNMENEPGFEDIANIAIQLCDSISKNHFKFEKFKSEIIDCWSNVYNRDSGCRIHQHFPAVFSLVYYVKVPENSGNIFFPDLEVQIKPYPGLMICFRGDTWHGVEFNQTNQDRIIVALNINYSNQS